MQWTTIYDAPRGLGDLAGQRLALYSPRQENKGAFPDAPPGLDVRPIQIKDSKKVLNLFSNR